MFLTVGFKVPSPPTFMIKYPIKIYIWYLRNWSNKSYHLYHHFYPQFQTCTFRIIIPNQCPLSIMYNILSLTHCTLLIAYMIPLSTRSLSLCYDQHSHFHRKVYNHLLADCYPCSIWPLVFPLNLTYTSLNLLLLFSTNQTYRDLHSKFQIPSPLSVA